MRTNVEWIRLQTADFIVFSVPSGRDESSPAIHRRAPLRSRRCSAVGTAEFGFNRPYGTLSDRDTANPALKGGASIVPASGRFGTIAVVKDLSAVRAEVARPKQWRIESK